MEKSLGDMRFPIDGGIRQRNAVRTSLETRLEELPCAAPPPPPPASPPPPPPPFSQLVDHESRHLPLHRALEDRRGPIFRNTLRTHGHYVDVCVDDDDISNGLVGAGDSEVEAAHDQDVDNGNDTQACLHAFRQQQQLISPNRQEVQLFRMASSGEMGIGRGSLGLAGAMAADVYKKRKSHDFPNSQVYIV